MEITRDKIVNQARSWLGTAFRHQGRVKKSINNKGGVDCLGLIICVAKELNLESGILDKNGNDIPVYKFDDLEYSRNSDPQKLLNGFTKACIEIELNEAKPADIILFKFEGMPKHLAIITSIIQNTNDTSNKQITIIHAFLRVGRVVEHIIDSEWKSRIAKVYRLRTLN